MYTKILLVLILLASFLIFLKSLTLNNYPDFRLNYLGAVQYMHGINPYLHSATPVTFIYPPSILFIYIPLSFLSIENAQIVFTILSILCFLASIFILFKLFKLSFFSNLGLLFLILALNFFPEKFTLGMGQINNLVLLCVCLFLYFYNFKKDIVSGTFISIAVVIKLFPLLLIPYLVIKKKWKILGAFTGVFLFFLLFIHFVLNSEFIPYFSRHILPSLLSGYKIDYYNQALSGFLARIIAAGSVFDLVNKILSAGFILFTFLILWSRNKNKKTELLSVSSLITISLIVNSFSWQHHFVFMLIPLLITFFHIKNNGKDKRLFIFLGLSYLLMAINLKNPSNFPILIQSHVLYGAFILYILNIYLLLKQKTA